MYRSILAPSQTIAPPRLTEIPWTRDADQTILDLEHSTPEASRKWTHAWLRKAIATARRKRARVAVRLNHTSWAADLHGGVWPGLAAVVYPKAESAEQICRLEAMINALERTRGIRPGAIEIQPLIATARGVTHALEIASGSRRVRVFARDDLGYGMAQDLGVEHRAGTPWAHYLTGECGLIAHMLQREPDLEASLPDVSLSAAREEARLECTTPEEQSLAKLVEAALFQVAPVLVSV